MIGGEIAVLRGFVFAYSLDWRKGVLGPSSEVLDTWLVVAETGGWCLTWMRIVVWGLGAAAAIWL